MRFAADIRYANGVGYIQDITLIGMGIIWQVQSKDQ